jgi:hypothetical protein
MGMPSGDTPTKVRDYYLYLQGHQETMQQPATWHVRWIDLAWVWGFVIALSLIALGWVWQYRTTHHRRSRGGGIYPVDEFGGFTTELAGPSSLFFILFSVFVVIFAVVLVVGHIVWGQKF